MAQDGPDMAQDGPRCLSGAVLGFHLGLSRVLPGFAFALSLLCLCLRSAFVSAFASSLLCLCLPNGGAPLAILSKMGDPRQSKNEERFKRKTPEEEEAESQA